MPHVITQSCCSDASCVYACPVNCIHPTPDEPDFLTAEMLYVDPKTCVDCGACTTACPVDAIKPHTKIDASEKVFLALSEDFYREPRKYPILAKPVPRLEINTPERLRVAIVGSGPAAMYAADEILTIPGTTVNMFERLPKPYGLARFGVAPDHKRTRQVSHQFDDIAARPGFQLYTGIEIGKHITHAELLAHHHAVIYAVGASTDRPLDVPGMGMPGTTSATEFVAWYNGHHDFKDREFDLSHKRAIVIGNGNVALDVARILTIDPARLAYSPIATQALDALHDSKIEEVVVVGRRGAENAAFTVPELVGLCSTGGIDVSVRVDELDGSGTKVDLLKNLPRIGTGMSKVEFRFWKTPVRILGEEAVTGVEFSNTRSGELEQIPAGLVLTSIGYQGRPVPDLPFDDVRGVVPNQSGRVAAGTYVTGWIKRGPSGFIGTNKSCAQETVRALVDDLNNGRLRTPGTRTRDLTARIGRVRRDAR
ncbi:MAG: FAD-dependent oxidoreductase [Nocardiaceae bacterium]|nr:FAD-dependent oxidoreductase [Nocardiaceae bacterium]